MPGAAARTARHGEGVTFALAARASAPERSRALPGGLACERFDDWCPEHRPGGRASASVAALGVALGASLAEEPRALRERVRAAVRDGRVLALREGGALLRATAAPATGAAEERPTDPAPRETRTWITLRLVDDADPPRPVARARYRVKLPDGEVREGTLDAMGTAHFEGIDPGACEVSFPDYDRDAWRRA